MAPEHEIREEIKRYIDTHGGPYRAWYVGIASDPRARLFNDHGVDERTDPWIFGWADSVDAARRVERYFIETLGTDGGPGGGDASTTSVYAYKKNRRTNP
jgi:hypothetical protein